MRWLVVSLAVAGCASAGKGNSIIGGLGDAGIGTERGDANDFPAIDAAVIDSPPQQITLTQTASTTVTRSNSLVCSDTATGLTSHNSYYRLFALSDYAVGSTLHVAEVEFAIQLADAGPSATEQPAQILLGIYRAEPSGTTLDPDQIESVNKVDIAIPNGAGTRMAVPITGDIDPGARLLVELDVPDGNAAGSKFVIGSNAQGERQPGYMSAPDCDVVRPTTLHSLTEQLMLGESDIILGVTGTM
jgi:hypothetical protein